MRTHLSYASPSNSLTRRLFPHHGAKRREAPRLSILRHSAASRVAAPPNPHPQRHSSPGLARSLSRHLHLCQRAFAAATIFALASGDVPLLGRLFSALAGAGPAAAALFRIALFVNQQIEKHARGLYGLSRSVPRPTSPCRPSAARALVGAASPAKPTAAHRPAFFSSSSRIFVIVATSGFSPLWPLAVSSFTCCTTALKSHIRLRLFHQLREIFRSAARSFWPCALSRSPCHQRQTS